MSIYNVKRINFLEMYYRKELYEFLIRNNVDGRIFLVLPVEIVCVDIDADILQLETHSKLVRRPKLIAEVRHDAKKTYGQRKKLKNAFEKCVLFLKDGRNIPFDKSLFSFIPRLITRTIDISDYPQPMPNWYPAKQEGFYYE